MKVVRLWKVNVGKELQKENKEILEDDSNKMQNTKKQKLRFLQKANSIQISHNENLQKQLTLLCRGYALVFVCGDWTTTR